MAGRGLLDRDRFRIARRRAQAVDGPQRLHRVPAGGARACRDDDVRGSDGRLDFGARDAIGVHARPLLRLARPRSLRNRMRARRPRRSRARARCGAATWRWSRTFSARRTSRGSTAASCSSRTSASAYGSSGCSTSLHHAGILARQRAILLGQFTEYALSDNDGGYDHRRRGRADRAACVRCPILTGLPFGHVPDKLTLPVGGRCEIDARDGRAARCACPITAGDVDAVFHRPDLHVAGWGCRVAPDSLRRVRRRAARAEALELGCGRHQIDSRARNGRRGRRSVAHACSPTVISAALPSF